MTPQSLFALAQDGAYRTDTELPPGWYLKTAGVRLRCADIGMLWRGRACRCIAAGVGVQGATRPSPRDNTRGLLAGRDKSKW